MSASLVVFLMGFTFGCLVGFMIASYINGDL